MTRFKLVFVLSLLCFFFLIARFYRIQVLNPPNDLAQNFLSFNKELSERGEIYDQNHIPLVINRQTFDVYADISGLKQNQKLKRVLKTELKIKNSTMSAYLKQKNWQRIKDNVNLKIKNKLLDYYPEYVNFEEEWVRYYPEGSSSAYILGFLGKDDLGKPQGYVGLEGYFNQELEGLPVINQKESDLQGIPFVGGIMSDYKKVAGLDLYLTIDKNIQQLVETELKQGMKLYEAKTACAIVMEPKSGNILALSCYPAFDPRFYYQDDSDFVNPLIAKVYEPGSTFKPLIVATGLENKRFQTNTTVPEQGPYKIADYYIRTWDNKYRGKISVQETLEKSSNVGMVELIRKIPQKEVDLFFDRLGLRSLSGIELEGEVNSLIKPRRDWYPIDFLTYSFGQGLAITPIQLLRAFNTFANDGKLVNPTLIDSYYDRNTKESIPSSNKTQTRVFSQKTVARMRKLLQSAVDNSEANWPNKPEGYRICGKTGTAQIPIGGIYDPTKTIASFIGFLPCRNPKFIALVLYREPKSSPWGSETAAPTFFDLANDLIFYYNIAPDAN